MTPEENAAIVRGWAQAAFNQHDLDAAAQFLAPHWVGHWAELGEEGFRRLAGAYLSAFRDMQIGVDDALAGVYASSFEIKTGWEEVPGGT